MAFKIEQTATFGDDCRHAFTVLWEERAEAQRLLATPGERKLWRKVFDKKAGLIDELLDAYNTWREIDAL